MRWRPGGLGRTEGVGPQGLALEGDLLPGQHGHEDGEVLLHVAGRMVEGTAPDPFHHHLVGEADPEGETPPGGGLDGEGLGRQHRRMAGMDGNDRRPERHRRDLPAHHGQSRQGVPAEDL